VSQSQVYERYRNLVAQRLPEMITVVQLIICSSIQGTRSCVTVLTSPRHWTLFLVIYPQSTTPPPPLLSLIQLYSQLHLQTISQQAFSLPVCRPKFVMNFSLLHKCYMSHQYCSPSLKRPNNTSKRVQIINILSPLLLPLC